MFCAAGLWEQVRLHNEKLNMQPHASQNYLACQNEQAVTRVLGQREQRKPDSEWIPEPGLEIVLQTLVQPIKIWTVHHTNQPESYVKTQRTRTKDLVWGNKNLNLWCLKPKLILCYSSFLRYVNSHLLKTCHQFVLAKAGRSQNSHIL